MVASSEARLQTISGKRHPRLEGSSASSDTSGHWSFTGRRYDQWRVVTPKPAVWRQKADFSFYHGRYTRLDLHGYAEAIAQWTTPLVSRSPLFHLFATRDRRSRIYRRDSSSRYRARPPSSVLKVRRCPPPLASPHLASCAPTHCINWHRLTHCLLLVNRECPKWGFRSTNEHAKTSFYYFSLTPTTWLWNRC